MEKLVGRIKEIADCFIISNYKIMSSILYHVTENVRSKIKYAQFISIFV